MTKMSRFIRKAGQWDIICEFCQPTDRSLGPTRRNALQAVNSFAKFFDKRNFKSGDEYEACRTYSGRPRIILACAIIVLRGGNLSILSDDSLPSGVLLPGGLA